ncbi:MAG: phasin family protein [Acidiferrobacterales bacterium]
MQPEIQNVVELINKLNTQALATAKEVAAINTRALDKLVTQQLGLVTEAVQGGVKQVELLREPKGVKEYVSAQAELAQDGAEKVLAATRETVAVLSGARDELSALVEKGVETVNASVKQAAAKKPA